MTLIDDRIGIRGRKLFALENVFQIFPNENALLPNIVNEFTI